MKKRVLVVDDERPILELLKFKLSRHGFEAVTAKDGDEFEALARSQKPNLIILDIWLKGKMGTDVYRHLLEEGFDRNVPVIFITALLEAQPPKLASPNGKYSLFSKPFDLEELMKEVDRLLADAKT